MCMNLTVASSAAWQTSSPFQPVFLAVSLLLLQWLALLFLDRRRLPFIKKRSNDQAADTPVWLPVLPEKTDTPL